MQILIITHGQLSKGILNATEMFVSDFKNIKAISLKEGENIDKFKVMIEEIIEVEKNKDILCLVDMLGGSPARVIGELAVNNSNIHLISGVNLPMVIEAIISYENMPVHELINHIMAIGKDSIVNLSQKLRN